MERQRQGSGLETFFEHWGFFLTVPVIIVLSQVLMFFINLSGMRWVYFLAASTLLLLTGAALILYAKLPVYRSGRFFTFGVNSVPQSLAGFYRWGWRVFLFGVALSLCLLLSKHSA